MKYCCDLAFLSTLACQIAECVDDDMLELYAASITTLGDMLAVIATRKSICEAKEAPLTEPSCDSSCRSYSTKHCNK